MFDYFTQFPLLREKALYKEKSCLEPHLDLQKDHRWLMIPIYSVEGTGAEKKWRRRRALGQTTPSHQCKQWSEEKASVF